MTRPVLPELSVQVSFKTPTDAYPMTRLERWIAGPGPAVVNKVCHRINLGCVFFALAYFLAWTAFVTLALAGKPALSFAQATTLSLAWAPAVALQLLTGAVRLASLTVAAKETEYRMSLVSVSFGELVGAAVTDAMGRFMAQHEAEQAGKPTLQ